MIALWSLAGLWLLASLAMQIGASRAARLGARGAPDCFRAPATAPGANTLLRIAFLGDLQKGVTDVVGPMARALRAEGAHLLVCSGDFASHGEAPYYGIVLRAFERAGIRTPTRVVPGNHDLFPRRCKDDRIGGPLFERHFGGRSFTLDLGRILLVGLDTGGDWTIESQLPAVQAAVTHREGRPWLAVTHRPPFRFDDEGAPLYRDLGPLAAFFETHRPAAVVTGHLHTFQDTEVNGVRYIVNAHGGDVAGDGFKRRDFELVWFEVEPDGTMSVRVAAYKRRLSLPALLDKLDVRLWADRRKPWGRVVGAPAALLWKLAGAYVPVVRHPVQRTYPTEEQVRQRTGPGKGPALP